MAFVGRLLDIPAWLHGAWLRTPPPNPFLIGTLFDQVYLAPLLLLVYYIAFGKMSLHGYM